MERKIYVFVEENKIIARGTADEIAKALNSTLNRVYNQYARTKAGKTRFKHIFLESELSEEKLSRLENRSNLRTKESKRALADKRIYAIYHGDKFVDVGTAEELTKKHNISPGSFYSRVSRSKTGEYKTNVIIIVQE
ncbi:hypothetical protein FP435_04730 [Lactobacillus sp. PV037]|uniref:hypothetical protein n=1 Tax=Lactobacillus sp. PV037 TaxID=2594496 RepID=UPI002240460F|nr:hypothetical protein [Lactobacillus sp. PV037]QNQ83796.1 hypothetical protein FP435_04730 [Lactobacillus sp. PV037]